MEIESKTGLARLIQAEATQETKGSPLGAAWVAQYRRGMVAMPNTPLGYAIKSIKKELIYRGFGKNIKSDTFVFGAAVENRVKEFQESVNIKADGVVGPQTSRRLFKKRVWAASHKYEVPALYLCKQLNLESGFDPAAIGYIDNRDRGLAQINSFWHPDVSDEEAFDPEFSIFWAANYLKNNFESLGDIDAALAAHNVGRFYSRNWLKASKPKRGLFTETGQDYAVTISKYLKLLKGREC